MAASVNGYAPSEGALGAVKISSVCSAVCPTKVDPSCT